MKTKYIRMRLTEAEDATIRKQARQAGQTITGYIINVITKSVITQKPDSVITNVPTAPDIDKMVKSSARELSKIVGGKLPGVRTKPPLTADYKGKVVRTKELTDESGTTITGYAENGDVVSVTKAGIEKTCASCSAKIKKGYLCITCLTKT